MRMAAWACALAAFGLISTFNSTWWMVSNTPSFLVVYVVDLMLVRELDMVLGS
jgi:hypothetical protein